jgi:hypothetical protein
LPETIEDVHRALVWIGSHADDWGMPEPAAYLGLGMEARP